jgi:hypothetical protein
MQLISTLGPSRWPLLFFFFFDALVGADCVLELLRLYSCGIYLGKVAKSKGTLDQWSYVLFIPPRSLIPAYSISNRLMDLDDEVLPSG